jgi:phenylpyruvate tautomerase PptA (4-oxalocrotonate tautomerase family)
MEDFNMPMIDIYAKTGTFADTKKLAREAADTVKTVEGVPDIPMFRKNVDGDSDYVRVQVLTNVGALDRGKQIVLVEKLTELVATSAGDDSLKQRTWVLLTEAVEGGWGLWGRAHTNDELVSAAKAEIVKLTSA